MSEKTAAERLREELSYQRKNGYHKIDAATREEIGAFSEGYKNFLTRGKTERACVALTIEEAKKHGFREFQRDSKLQPGDKIYVSNRGKAVIFAVIGTEPLENGVHIAAAHIDAPCIHLKQNPLYEENELCMFKTHYYGGIKKYQWPAIPLELRGVIAFQDGHTITVEIGSDPGDPIFTITDLLPHLGKDQMQKTMLEGVPGESLNILVGSEPMKGDRGDDLVKLNVLRLLNEKYGMHETDFLSAELAAVPAFDARDLGFDRSMIGSYGHDDRVCAYPSVQALFATEAPKKTAVCILADKEEIGSEGVSGMKSAHFDTFIEDICEAFGARPRACFEKSCCLSTDVLAGYDPNFPDVLDRRNAAMVNHGVALCKYTGSRGKSGASDAAAELVARMRRIFDGADVAWQMGALGKVDQGGGGTVAMYMAERNIDTIDAGVPVLSMHAPFEVVSKLDVYMTFKAIRAFFAE